jgi:hypothetical protein
MFTAGAGLEEDLPFHPGLSSAGLPRCRVVFLQDKVYVLPARYFE